MQILIASSVLSFSLSELTPEAYQRKVLLLHILKKKSSSTSACNQDSSTVAATVFDANLSLAESHASKKADVGGCEFLYYRREVCADCFGVEQGINKA